MKYIFFLKKNKHDSAGLYLLLPQSLIYHCYTLTVALNRISIKAEPHFHKEGVQSKTWKIPKSPATALYDFFQVFFLLRLQVELDGLDEFCFGSTSSFIFSGEETEYRLLAIARTCTEVYISEHPIPSALLPDQT